MVNQHLSQKYRRICDDANISWTKIDHSPIESILFLGPKRVKVNDGFLAQCVALFPNPPCNLKIDISNEEKESRPLLNANGGK